MGLLDDPTGEANRDLAAMGGVLTCLSCNYTIPLGDAGDIGRWLAKGWPTCCGHTMHWVTARQMGAESLSPLERDARVPRGD